MRREEAAAARPKPARPAPTEQKPPSRSELRNEAVRAKLEPLGPGERPRAVTIGAVLAGGLAAAEPVFYVFADVDRSAGTVFGALLFTGLMGMMAWGLWNSRYWAVLGLQAVLGIVLIVFGISLPLASDLKTVAIALAVLIPAGALFWFLIKAMARIQMPERG
jgi:hypothetical protein